MFRSILSSSTQNLYSLFDTGWVSNSEQSWRKLLSSYLVYLCLLKFLFCLCMCAYVCCLRSIKMVHRHPQSSMVKKWLESQSEGENVFEKRRQHTFLSVLKITLYWNHCSHSSLARWTLLSPICPGHHRILEECLKLSIGQEWQRVADHNRHPLPIGLRSYFQWSPVIFTCFALLIFLTVLGFQTCLWLCEYHQIWFEHSSKNVPFIPKE